MQEIADVEPIEPEDVDEPEDVLDQADEIGILAPIAYPAGLPA